MIKRHAMNLIILDKTKTKEKCRRFILMIDFFNTISWDMRTLTSSFIQILLLDWVQCGQLPLALDWMQCYQLPHSLDCRFMLSVVTSLWLWVQCDQLPPALEALAASPLRTISINEKQNKTFLPLVAFVGYFIAGKRKVI